MRSALIVGVTGIAGSALAERLTEDGWEVHGLSRSPFKGEGAVRSHQADLQDPGAVAAALEGVRPSHVFFTTWARQDTEAENCRVNGAMLRHLLDAVGPGGTVEHVALLTGLKHYLGAFESYGQGDLPETPFREDAERLPGENFYYVQEDLLFEAAERFGFDWTVHRAHTMTGFAVGNAMNLASTVGAQAALCRRTGRPFRFPGSAQQWNGLTDMTDTAVLAAQMAWTAEHPEVRNEAYNVVNGDVFRWRRMWPALADMLGVQPDGFDGTVRPLEDQMADAAPVWAELAAEHGLAEADVTRVASWWHTDGDLGREIECVTDTSKAREAGFLVFERTEDAFERAFERYRAAGVLPPL